MLGDNHGNVVHFYDRDCSIQRRHQKVIEIAPSLYLTRKSARRCAYAGPQAGHVDYRNAGTIEFLMDPEGKHYFIEINPRIQVEHTVTEMITSRNLVQTQIRVAYGHKLADPEIGIPCQRDIELRGYAIQCRITTEDPTNNFAPDFGTLKAYRSAAGFGVRLDAGNAYSGANITPHYDSLLVKMSTWGLNFHDASRTMHRALQEFRVRGVKTNIGFLENVITHPIFLAVSAIPPFSITIRNCSSSGRRRTAPTSCSSSSAHYGQRLSRDQAATALSSKDLRATVRISPSQAAPPRYPRHSPRKRSGGAGQMGAEEQKLLITDTTMRDAHQSLTGHPGPHLRSRARLPRRPPIFGGGLFSLEMWGGATYDVSMRFLREDPWERLDRLRQKIPNILFQMLLRGSNAVGYTNYPTTWSKNSLPRRPRAASMSSVSSTR